MKIFDLHCDTLFETEKQKTDIRDANCPLDVTGSKSAYLEQYVQVTAIWSENTLSPEEQWRRFYEIYDYAMPRLPAGFENILAVEGGGLLDNDIRRLDTLYAKGVRIFTPMWAGENCLGGAHDTGKGLTNFGKEAIKHCFELGIVPDISHSSDASAYDILSIAALFGKPVIASHSLSRSVHFHRRNLTDTLFKAVKNSGGVVGISLEPTHLGGDSVEAVMKHILHFLLLGGEDTLCLGCDFDGTTAHLSDIDGIDKMPLLYDRLKSEGVDPDKLFWQNACNFAIKNSIKDR